MRSGKGVLIFTANGYIAPAKCFRALLATKSMLFVIRSSFSSDNVSEIKGYFMIGCHEMKRLILNTNLMTTCISRRYRHPPFSLQLVSVRLPSTNKKPPSLFVRFQETMKQQYKPPAFTHSQTSPFYLLALRLLVLLLATIPVRPVQLTVGVGAAVGCFAAVPPLCSK